MRHLVKIPIIKKNFEKTKSAKFKGELQIISNKYGIIYDWKIYLSEVYLDLYSTPAWWKNKSNNLFKIREKLFNKLNLEQEKRPSTSERKIKQLNSDQIEIMNNFFNNREEYKSTIKNIVGVLKGNNPGGEAKKPSSAEMIIDSEESGIKNFVILLDDLIMKNKINFLSVKIGSKNMLLEEFVKLNEDIESAFKYMQEKKRYDDFSKYLKSIKEYSKQYNIDDDRIDKIIKKERSKYSTNIDKKITKFPFGLENKNQFQKCHIYEVNEIKEEMICEFRDTKSLESKSFKKLVKMISDPNNFIPLNGEHHRQFDQRNFTYSLNGEILTLNEKGKNYISKYMEENFKKIDNEFLNKERKTYLKMRNKNI